MAGPIEAYALIGDMQTAALVSIDGSIDWLCLPRFDSGACFAALLGNGDNGRWTIAPAGGARRAHRRYVGDTLVLETTFETDDGVVRVVDFMPPRSAEPDLIRIVGGVEGSIDMRTELVLRFDYGSIVPWVRSDGRTLRAVAGPDAVTVRSAVPMHGENLTTVADFPIAKGDRIAFTMVWHPSTEEPPSAPDAERALGETISFWESWTGGCTYRGTQRAAVVRSLITLKALTHSPTGGIVASPTTSLPEKIGGVRNWDYRICWVRDATFTLYALLLAGYQDEAKAWRDWMLRAAAGHPAQLRHMYGIGGERRLPELSLPWLTGYENSVPVRVGNAATNQFQLDVFGEIMDLIHVSQKAGIDPDPTMWELQRVLMDHLESCWTDPDEGIWEVRGEQRHFTHSKVMAWVAMDRAVKAVERFGHQGPVERWRTLRDQIHDSVCANGFNEGRGAFIQSYGSDALDASLLLIPLVGFLPAGDERVRGTVRAIENELLHDGLVMRYSHEGAPGVDGLPAGEGTFLACSFWLADNYALSGRIEEATALFDRLCSLRNDVGLMAEEYDPKAGRMLGNFPLALSHVALINTAYNLSQHGSAQERPDA